jgi:integration host factor subunit alpha
MGAGATLTRAELCDAIQNEIGLSRAECSQMVDSVIGHMSDALAKGENVKISGFGTFILRDKPQRIGRNPMTGVEVVIPPRRVLTFRASPRMRERVAAGA